MKISQIKATSAFGAVEQIGVQYQGQWLNLNQALTLHYKREGYYNAEQRSLHKLPTSLSEFLNVADQAIDELLQYEDIAIKFVEAGELQTLKEEDIQLSLALNNIPCYRDFYAHEKHVAKGFEKRNEPIPEAWYQIPAYYKGSTAGFIGPEEEILWPSYTNILDYELELGMVIGRDGFNVKEKHATRHIFGFTILNDISARDIQKKEMAIRLGPAKGKDFCTIIGPVITTIDEFNFKEPNLKMTAKVNGELWSEGQSGDTHFSFSQMIEHVSMDEWLRAGDLFGSGTVGTGCGLEIDKWIQKGDEIEMEVESIGVLKNRIMKD